MLKILKIFIFFFALLGSYSPVISQDMNGSSSGGIQATAFVSAPAGLVKLSDFNDQNKISEFKQLAHKIILNVFEEDNETPFEILIYHPSYNHSQLYAAALESSGGDKTIFSYSKSLPFVTTEKTDNHLIATLIYTEN